MYFYQPYFLVLVFPALLDARFLDLVLLVTAVMSGEGALAKLGGRRERVVEKTEERSS